MTDVDADTAGAVGNLEALLREAEALPTEVWFGPRHLRWIFNTRFALEDYFGSASTLAQTFASLDYKHHRTIYGHYPEEVERKSQDAHLEAYGSQLGMAQGIIQSAIDRLSREGLAEVRRAAGRATAASNGRIFISHGGDPPALTKVEGIVRALGFEPVVVGKEASKGMSVDQLVRERMRECCCAIILATRDAESPESGSPRGNVLHETGLAQEIFDDKVIYLLEKGVEFPSNLRPKVYESFSADNFEPLWGKIVKELRAFKFMQ